MMAGVNQLRFSIGIQNVAHDEEQTKYVNYHIKKSNLDFYE